MKSRLRDRGTGESDQQLVARVFARRKQDIVIQTYKVHCFVREAVKYINTRSSIVEGTAAAL